MTIEQIQTLAYGKQNKNNNIRESKENNTMTTKIKNEVKVITKVQDINSEFIEEFVRTASEEDYQWIMQRAAQLSLEKKNYFPSFRSEFARRFFPELVGKKQNSVSFIDRLVSARDNGNFIAQ